MADHLAFTPDLYGGAHINSASLPPSPEAFSSALRSSLAAWRSEGVRGVWLTLPLALCTHIPPAVEAGFAYRHATPASLTLTHWLDDSSPCQLPSAPHTAVGVGAFLLNAAGELLVVQERRGPAARPGLWKLPTGLVDRGEDVAAAAVREVLEETGVEAVFDSVVGFRHLHALAPFANCDLFFLCVLRLKDAERTELRAQPSEIAACAWMRLSEFEQQAHVRDKSTVLGHLHDLCVKVTTSGGQDPSPPVIKPRLLPSHYAGAPPCVVFSPEGAEK